MIDDAYQIDKRQARRSFGRAAARYDAAAALQHEIGRRLVERLDYVKLQPQRVLDVGCGTGVVTDALLKRYPKAQVLGLDFALPMLAHTRRRGRWLRRPQCLCGDLDALPLAGASIDLIVANASLQWSNRPAETFVDLARILRADGLLMFTSFGPDTLRELRAAWAEVDGHEHVHNFIDMHDYGDMLMGAGFADPVMDVEHITLTYSDAHALMADLKLVGTTNAGGARRRGLTGRARLDAVCAAYERFRAADGRLPLTYEVIYGHAWGARARTIAGETHIAVDVLRHGRG